MVLSFPEKEIRAMLVRVGLVVSSTFSLLQSTLTLVLEERLRMVATLFLVVSHLLRVLSMLLAMTF
jgi:hypothetical protein